MKVRDMWNCPISEGDRVAISINNNVSVGHVVKTPSIDSPNPNEHPVVLVNLILGIPVQPNGVLLGVAKAAPEEKQIEL